MRDEAGAEQHSSTAQQSSTPGREDFFDVALVRTDSDERQQWRLVAERRQINGLHMTYVNLPDL
jgi:hypothetical protein